MLRKFWRRNLEFGLTERNGMLGSGPLNFIGGNLKRGNGKILINEFHSNPIPSETMERNGNEIYFFQKGEDLTMIFN